jgi:hypothetical protein
VKVLKTYVPSQVTSLWKRYSVVDFLVEIKPKNLC